RIERRLLSAPDSVMMNTTKLDHAWGIGGYRCSARRAASAAKQVVDNSCSDSGIIGHGRTDWMKSDNCLFSSSHDPKHTLEEGGGKGGRGGQRDRQPRPARFRANSCNEN